MNRRTFTRGVAAALTAVGMSPMLASASTMPLHSLRSKKLRIGALIFERMDQIDFTGPYAVLSRLPESTLQVMSLDGRAIKDHKGLTLTPDIALADASTPDVLLIPGGPGQEALMDDERVLSLIRRHSEANGVIFSVCTGALVCGAAGILRGRRATTHWAAFDLLKYFGATPVESRVVVDDNIVSAAGITAGIDGALQLAALVRSEQVAQEIQLDIQYSPEPPFDSGSPDRASRAVLEGVSKRYAPLTDARRETARRIAKRFGIS